jgi:excisionase family DNA binding protein
MVSAIACLRDLIDPLRRTAEVLEQLVPVASHCLLGRVPAAINERATAAARVPSKLAYSVGEVSKLVGISRSAIYLALRAKELRAVKSGRKTLGLAKDRNEWLEKLPAKTWSLRLRGGEILERA